MGINITLYVVANKAIFFKIRILKDTMSLLFHAHVLQKYSISVIEEKKQQLFESNFYSLGCIFSSFFVCDYNVWHISSSLFC